MTTENSNKTIAKEAVKKLRNEVGDYWNNQSYTKSIVAFVDID